MIHTPRTLVLWLCTLISLCTFAQHDVKFGYCNDSLSARKTYATNNENTEKNLGGAILIPAARLQMLKGEKITHIRFACSEGLTNVFAWARYDLKDHVIGKPTKVGTTIEGWNDVTFDQPIEITGQDLYIGFSGTASTGAKIYFDGTANPNGAYAFMNDEWHDLYEYIKYPPLCLQVFVSLDSDLPLVDLGLEKAKFNAPYTQRGNDAEVAIQVGNYGEKGIEAPKMFYSLNGGNPVSITTTDSINTNGSTTYRFNIATTPLTEGKFPLTIWAETNDPYKANDTLHTNLLVYETSYPHKVLCEHFTTLKCGNCPIGHDALAQLFSGRTDYVWVAHHIGYGTDELTQQVSYELKPFGISSAPLAMFDRRILKSSKSDTHPVMGINWSSSVESSVQAISPNFEACVATPAFVSVDIQNHYDATTRELTTTVSGSRNQLFNLFYEHPQLTVELVEDGVVTQQQQYPTGETIHNNVFRQALSAIIGDDIKWTGDDYTATYTTTLPETYNDKNVRVVAFVALLTTDTSHADVLNANELNIHLTTGINTTTADAPQVLSRTLYNLQGQRINTPQVHGAYLERIVTTQGVKTIKHVK